MNISVRYSPGYIDNVFGIWYLNGRPHATKLLSMIPLDPNANDRPTSDTLFHWMKTDEWIQRTSELDYEVEASLKSKYAEATIEMLERHSTLGKEMQTIAMTWLKEHKEELTPGTAVRLLVDGVNIEQSTASIPDMLRKVRDMTDDKLQETLEKALLEAPIELDADN